MKPSHLMPACITFAMCIGLSFQALAQAPVAASAAAPIPYQPSMSDLMNIGVQPRHIKLWLAGKQQNWVYATYELEELRNAFARVGRTVPVYRTLDIPALTTAFMQQSLDTLDMAIRNHDAKAFTAAYRQLTDSCNACHQSSQHGMVVIKVPDADAYVDQEFRAQTR